VFDWGKALAAQKQANLQADQVDTQRAIAERGFARELADARAALRTQFDQVSTAEQEVKNAAESLRLAKLRYEAGEGSALEVVDSQSALARAQVNYFTAIRDYFAARAEMEVATGR
jgi:OMF family outer membrane factor